MNAHRVLAVVFAAAALLAACGDDDSAGHDSTSTGTGVTAPSTSTSTSTGVTAPSTSTGALVGLDQPAIWPAADVVFETPEAAAEDFVTEVLGVSPTLGEFQPGDSRSGEIEVFSPGEGDAPTPVVRGRLLLRQMGAGDGWFILAAANDNAAIAVPTSRDEVAAGPLVVEGGARGFEANVVVTAFPAGDAGALLDRVITQGGAFEMPEPFAVTLDLTRATPADTVVLLVRGGAGLETDPGEFCAIPVVVEA